MSLYLANLNQPKSWYNPYADNETLSGELLANTVSATIINCSTLNANSLVVNTITYSGFLAAQTASFSVANIGFLTLNTFTAADGYISNTFTTAYLYAKTGEVDNCTVGTMTATIANISSLTAGLATSTGLPLATGSTLAGLTSMPVLSDGTNTFSMSAQAFSYWNVGTSAGPRLTFFTGHLAWTSRNSATASINVQFLLPIVEAAGRYTSFIVGFNTALATPALFNGLIQPNTSIANLLNAGNNYIQCSQMNNSGEFYFSGFYQTA